jgi:2'-5' RNA ligase
MIEIPQQEQADKTTQLQLIAVLPSDEVSTLVRQQQQHIATVWGPKHALRTPPHITLIPPIAVTEADREVLWTCAERISKRATSFPLHLDGYSAFKPHVIYIHVTETTELNQLFTLWRKELMSVIPHVLEKYPDRPYRPHMTLAHRDVTPAQFKQIWEYYAELEFSASFEVDRFWILRHEMHGWVKEEMFDLKTQN